LIQPQDLIKLIYQAEFGPGHLIQNPLHSRQMLIEEYHSINHKVNHTMSHSHIENIGNGLARFYLDTIPEEYLDALNLMFVKTAEKRFYKHNIQEYQDKLDLLLTHFEELGCSFSKKDLFDYISQHKEQGFPMVRHSAKYRDAYQPAYRVTDERYIPYIKLIAAILKQQEINQHSKQATRLIIGIDGNCASGKSTLALLLLELFDAQVIHMDDFFLPPNLRTPKRFEIPGQNVHYERFLTEVVNPLKQMMPTFEYRPFSCKTMNYENTRRIDGTKMIIIEGAYSMRPDIREIYDLKVFLQIDQDLQMQRIMKRNGPEMSENFKNKWIPMENKYFEYDQIRDICDLVYETGEHMKSVLKI